mgnify:CR=1 FL=1
MPELPIACALTPDALTARREGLLAALVRRAAGRDVLTNGYRLRFSQTEDVLPLIAQTIDAERRCCPFLRFDLAVEPDLGPIVLDLTGPSGTREFLTALLDG